MPPASYPLAGDLSSLLSWLPSVAINILMWLKSRNKILIFSFQTHFLWPLFLGTTFPCLLKLVRSCDSTLVDRLCTFSMPGPLNFQRALHLFLLLRQTRRSCVEELSQDGEAGPLNHHFEERFQPAVGTGMWASNRSWLNYGIWKLPSFNN